MLSISGDLIQILNNAAKVTVLTGAGISTESGIPNFRDAQAGLWKKFSPQELATPRGFRKNPELVWKWYAWRRELILEARPNAAHLALVEMEKYFKEWVIITQNIDGLHQRAGSTHVIELHGNIHRARCSPENLLFEPWPETDAFPPACPSCGKWLRPDVVWFGENLPAEALEKAVHHSTNCDVMLSIGTSTVVEPAASLPVFALQNKVVLVEINPNPTPVTPYAQFHYSEPAARFLPRLLSAIKR